MAKPGIMKAYLDKSGNAYLLDGRRLEFVAVSGTGGTSDHGSLVGLADDDHEVYIPFDGSRPFIGDVLISGTNDSASLSLQTDGGTFTSAAIFFNDASLNTALAIAFTPILSSTIFTYNQDLAFSPGDTSQTLTLINYDFTNAASTDTFIMPLLDGNSNDAMTTDGAGNLSFAPKSTKVVRETGSTGSIQDTDELIAATAGSITLTLPAASTAGAGRQYIIKDKNGNAGGTPITVASGTAGDDIDGDASFILSTNFESVTLVSDGTSRWMSI